MRRLLPLGLLWTLCSLNARAEGQAEQSDSDEESSDTMVVTATRTEIPLGSSPVATEVILRDEIEASGAEDLAGLLEEHPGVAITRSYLGTSVRLQGLEPEHVLILIDGKRVMGAKGGVIDLSRYSVENIERIEIVKGPSSALYGSDAMGGVIHIVTRNADAPFMAQLHARGGTLSARDVSGSAGLQREAMSTLFTAGHHSRDAYDLDPSTESTTGSAIHQFDVANDSRLELTPDTAMMTHIGYMRRTLEGVDLSGTGAVFDRTNVIEEFQSSVRPRWVPNERELWSIDGAFSMYRDQYLADQRGSGALDKYEDTREHLGQATVQHDRFMGERHHLTLGMDGLAQTMRSERLSEGEGQRLGVAFFAQDVWEIYDGPSRLTLVPGARLDLDTSFGVYPTPKMGLRYDPSDAVAIRASYGWGYRAPVFKELLLLFENPGAGYVVEGNPELDPETSQSVQLGLEVDPIPWLWVSSNAFYNQVDDLISIGTLAEAEAGEPTRYGYVNIASATTRGLEAATRVELAELAAVHLSYTLTDSIDQELDRPLEGRALHRATAKLTGGPTASGLHGLVRAGYVGSRPFYIDTDNDQIEETIAIDPYVTLDARVAKHFGPVLEIFAGADNLLNVGDASFTQVPPRFFYLGLNGRFAKATDPSPS